MATQAKQTGSKEQWVPGGKVILRSDKEFTSGMFTGYLDYFLQGYAGTPKSDTELFRLLIDALCAPNPETFCAG